MFPRFIYAVADDYYIPFLWLNNIPLYMNKWRIYFFIFAFVNGIWGFISSTLFYTSPDFLFRTLRVRLKLRYGNYGYKCDHRSQEALDESEKGE